MTRKVFIEHINDDMKVVSRTTIENAYARGQVRLFKQQLAARYDVYDAAYKTGRIHDLADDMVKCTKAGRARALAKVRKLAGAALHFEDVRDNGRLGIFSVLMPRESVVADERAPGALLQDCVAVNFFTLGVSLDDASADISKIAEGLWTLEVPDHVLGRIVERSGPQYLQAAIRDAHHNLLQLPADTAVRLFSGTRADPTCIKAGPGYFLVQMKFGPDTTLHDHSMYVRVATYYTENEMRERYLRLTEKGQPGDRLGDSWLLPWPLRKITQTGKTSFALHVHPWRSKKEKA